MGITWNAAIAEAVQRASDEDRFDVETLPLRALALHAFRFSPAAAWQLAAHGRPLGVCLKDIVAPRAGGRLGEGDAVQRALKHILDGPRLPVPTCTDHSPAEMMRFAMEHGLTSLLAEPAQMAVERMLGRAQEMVLRPQQLRAPLRVLLEQRVPLVADVLEVEAAIRVARASAAWPPPLVCEGAHQLPRVAAATALRGLIMARGAESAEDLWPSESVYASASLDGEGLNFEMHGRTTARVRVNIDADGNVGVRPSEGPGVLRALVLAFDLVNEPEPGSDHLDAWFTPPHGELLDVLRQLQRTAEPAGNEREERVVWVVSEEYGGVMVEPYVQKRTKRGFSLGARAKIGEVLAGEHGASEQDLAAARFTDRNGVGQGDCLRALMRHPLVFLRDKRGADDAVAVLAHDARVAIDEGDGGAFAVRLTAGDVVLDPERLRYARDLDAFVTVDELRRRVVVARIPSKLRALAMTLWRVSTIPASARDEMHALADGLHDDAPVSLPPSLQGELVSGDERVFVRLTLEQQALTARIGHRPIEHGSLVTPDDDGDDVAGLRAGKRVRAARDRVRERASAAAVRERLPLDALTAVDEWTFSAQTPDAQLDLVERLYALTTLDDGAASNVVVEWKDGKPLLAVVGRAQASSLKIGVRSVHEWLAVDGSASVDDNVLELGAMLEAVRNGRRYVPLSDGKFVALADSLRARLLPIAAFTSDEDGKLEVAPSAAGALDDLRDDGAHFDDTDAWRRIAARAKNARAASDVPAAALMAELRPYQRDGVRFLRRLAAWETGGVLADDMGLGKTVQATSLLLDRCALGPQLVLAPTSVCFNWQRELARFAPSLRVRMLSAAPVDGRTGFISSLLSGEVLVAGYAMATSCADAMLTTTFATAILDEAQAVKNAETLRARLARDLKAQQKIALSGTPLENHLGELWSIFRVVSPGLLGSMERFRKRFAIPIERDRSVKKRQELAQTLRPFLLRRTKGEVARELPQRTEIVADVELSDAERELYEATRQSVLADATKGDVGASGDRRFRVLAGLTRLRLLACHPRLVDADSPVPSSKLQAVLRHIVDLQDNGHRALVFSQFVKHLEIVKQALTEAKVPWLMLDGSTPAKEREKLVDAFQSGTATVFLLSLKAGGAGLNLTAADYVLHLDPWWNPAVEDQATGRAHRIGQTQPVTVYRFVARGTIEQQMLALHAEKRDLVDSVLEGADAAGTMSVDDLVAMLRT